MMTTKKKTINPPLTTIEHMRDAYGFIIRPQHVQRYRQYANIYKEEEEERSDRWNFFLERVSESAQFPIDGLSAEAADKAEGHKVAKANINDMYTSEGSVERGTVALAVEKKKARKVQVWSEIRSPLCPIEEMMSVRVKKSTISSREWDNDSQKASSSIEDASSVKRGPEEDSEEGFYDVDRLDLAQDVPSTATGSIYDGINLESSYPWKEELEVLVRGGLPMALRGELWQAFAGVKVRRIDTYYQELLSLEGNPGNQKNDESDEESLGLGEKWKRQIEKDLPRTFPGHPALDEDGRNALRRLLIAYARHNPSVGYCQAMNFFGGLLLLLMPEENAFWTLMGIMDDYFDGYYTEEMIECQVDQLVFEELVRERLPKLVNHLDYLGVQVAWVTGPWFLSIFMNMLPWESVLRIWDVLLFEGNRVILFRTALALMELYGPALVTSKDAGDAATLLQSLAGSTFDSSQLVLTACMGYQNVHEARLSELRDKHRPSVIASNEDRSKGLKALENSKLYSFKHDPGSVMINEVKVAEETTHSESGSTTLGDYFIGTTGSVDIIPSVDLQEQVGWLKIELCKLLEEKSSAELRAEELQTALMEMVKQDNRRQLHATIEKMEQEVSKLRRAMANKQEQENAMLQVLMRVEQEQRVTEDARMFAEEEAGAQRNAAQVLQEKYEKAMVSLAEMEKRLVMSESMLKATLQYQSGQIKAQTSPRSIAQPSTEVPPRITSLLARPFVFGWREKNKGIPANAAESS